jgi:hypothetical protein
MSATQPLDIPLWLAFLLTIPICALVMVMVRWLFVPVAGAALAPFKRFLGPKFDLEQVRSRVVLGAAVGTVVGWISFLILVR